MLTHFKSKGQKFYKNKKTYGVAQPFHKQIQNIKEENYVNRKITKRLFKRS